MLDASGADDEEVIQGRVVIDGRRAIAKIDSDFVCATMDWWPPEKCDYGTCSWGHASLLNVVCFCFLKFEFDVLLLMF